ncbi:MAG: hypothetical protein AAGD35_06350 [Actinomycetota bacterium]
MSAVTKMLAALTIGAMLLVTVAASPAAADGKAWGGDVIVRDNAWSGYSCGNNNCDVNLGGYRYIRVRVDCSFPSRDYYSAWMTADEIEGGSWGKRCLGGVNKVQLQVSTRKGFCSWWHGSLCRSFVQNYD